MKLLGLNGSPRKNGQTATLVNAVLESALAHQEEKYPALDFQIELLHIADYPILPCIGCDKCLRKPHTCPLSEQEGDTMTQLDAKLQESSALVIGAPSYFASPPAQLKLFFDRSRPMKMNNYQWSDLLFGAVVTSGLVSGGVGSTLDALIGFALTQAMVVVPGKGHPILVPNIAISSLQGRGVKEFHPPEEISDVAVASAKSLGTRLVDLLRTD